MKAKDEQKERLKERDMIASHVAKMVDKPKGKVKKGGVRYLRAVARVIIEWLTLFRRIRKKRLAPAPVRP